MVCQFANDVVVKVLFHNNKLDVCYKDTSTFANKLSHKIHNYFNQFPFVLQGFIGKLHFFTISAVFFVSYARSENIAWVTILI